jgi:hypothetical protein
MGTVMGFLQIPAFAPVSQHFDKKRSAAVGMTVSGPSIGGIIIHNILSKMLNASNLWLAWTVRVISFVILRPHISPNPHLRMPAGLDRTMNSESTSRDRNILLHERWHSAFLQKDDELKFQAMLPYYLHK